MDGVTAGGHTAVRIVRWTARGLLVLWAAFWMFFNIASGIGELGHDGWMALAMHFLMAAVAVLFLWAAWKLELIAGLFLIAASVLGFFFFDVAEQPLVGVVFLLPLCLSGIALVWCWRRSYKL